MFLFLLIKFNPNTSKVIESNYTTYGTFCVDHCKFQEPYYNPIKIQLNMTNCDIQIKFDIQSYSILPFKEEDSGSFVLNNCTHPTELNLIPNTVKIDSPRTYYKTGFFYD